MSSTKFQAVITGGGGDLAKTISCGLTDPQWIINAPSKAELDVTSSTQIHRYFENRRVDLLVCVAGVIKDAPLPRQTAEDWDHIWRVNYQGALDCAKSVIPTMSSNGKGHVIFISSFSALKPAVGQSAYATSKAALLGLVADLAQQHGKSNIRVNAILPGFLETRMTRNVSDARRAEVFEQHQLGRFNTCERVAAFIRFLHHELPHTSGQVFQLDSRVSRSW